MRSPELWREGWKELSVADAYFLGRLATSGIALPNTPGLITTSLEVTDPGDPAVQREIDRMAAAMDGIATIPGTLPVGLEHSQLVPSEDAPNPLQIVLVPTEIDGAPTEITIGGQAFQALLNTKLELPHNPPPSQRLAVKEGCFSSGPFNSLTRRPANVLAQAQNRLGDVLRPTEIAGYGAVILQHEVLGHSQGMRAADERDRIRNWVPRQQVADYRGLSPGQARQWHTRATYPQWRAFSRAAEYVYFPRPDLQRAFAAGQQAQREALSR